jgi:hypothetical protein
MTRHRHRRAASPGTRFSPWIAAVLAAAAVASPATAQSPDWRKVDNPYQEDVEYAIGAIAEPAVEVDDIRWRSFKIETPEEGPFAAGESIRTDVTVEFENRGNTSARILVIFLLEDEDGGPLDRIEVKPFKLAGGRLKERKETVELAAEVVGSTRRVYLFFEVMD